ncbi:metallophosphoesterase family protein [Sphingomonas canadensis]|uniref:Metallophosphoesterase family protein n=1 Tax=Sphingomonas canadensis TaxID=1219257 RepID=A0ABW3H3M5_9SPHN|nr:metallophosphoesterase family protein [Sphingomonas canadensis]MCW3835482.1 serine/threonine protein phosphatase [Sphingomonas canadensis]
MNFFRRFAKAPRQHRIPPGRRIYAIGDIHGRADLLDQLLDAVGQDDAARPRADTELVFLGDLIDRGPDSAAVVRRVRELCRAGVARLLKGNHEEVFVNAAFGDARCARGVMGLGGVATLKSYGISEDQARNGSFDDLSRLISRRVPQDDIAFLDGAEDMIVIGDYLFVHAGIRPGVPLEEQKGNDLRWIRESFLKSGADHGLMVIHGHSITPDVEEMPNRIGVDTGAFFSGKLSAIGLEGAARWVVSVQGEAAEYQGDDTYSPSI